MGANCETVGLDERAPGRRQQRHEANNAYLMLFREYASQGHSRRNLPSLVHNFRREGRGKKCQGRDKRVSFSVILFRCEESSTNPWVNDPSYHELPMSVPSPTPIPQYRIVLHS
jgi:hypothetical protein